MPKYSINIKSLPIEINSKAQEEAEKQEKEFVDQRLVVIKEKDLLLLLEKLEEHVKCQKRIKDSE